nr:MAG TPA: hypothetical protein [Caudoviricetes sp.]
MNIIVSSLFCIQMFFWSFVIQKNPLLNYITIRRCFYVRV